MYYFARNRYDVRRVESQNSLQDNLQVRQAIKNYWYSNSKCIIERTDIYNKVVKEAYTRRFPNKRRVIISEIHEWLA